MIFKSSHLKHQFFYKKINKLSRLSGSTHIFRETFIWYCTKEAYGFLRFIMNFWCIQWHEQGLHYYMKKRIPEIGSLNRWRNWSDLKKEMKISQMFPMLVNTHLNIFNNWTQMMYRLIEYDRIISTENPSFVLSTKLQIFL